MKHRSKVDVYILAAILLGILVFILGDYWIAGPVLLVLFLCAYPQSYETTADALVVRTALSRLVIPYRLISFVGPVTDDPDELRLAGGCIRVQYGPAGEVVISPADCEAFFRDMARRTPHLIKRGQRLFAAYAA